MVGWLLNTVLALGLIFALYKTFHGSELDKAGNVCYGSLSHVAWGLVLGWIVCACYYGFGSKSLKVYFSCYFIAC